MKRKKNLILSFNKFVIVLGYKCDGTPVIIGVVRDKIWSEANCCEEDNASGIELLSYDAPVSAPSLGVWTVPSTITVQQLILNSIVKLLQ